MSDKTSGQEMLEKLSYKKKNVYEEANAEKIKKIFDYSVGYMKYLDDAKTEREAVVATVDMARKFGYTEYKIGEKLSAGDKKYFNHRNKIS